ncbi:hypothetical protein EON67_09065 [archaeon]|nr:MAG: hypothetical protein EON67_09065 [archaeon]
MRAGEVDVLVIDVEGFEWQILRAFPIAHWLPKVVIVEMQKKAQRYARSPLPRACAHPRRCRQAARMRCPHPPRCAESWQIGARSQRRRAWRSTFARRATAYFTVTC